MIIVSLQMYELFLLEDDLFDIFCEKKLSLRNVPSPTASRAPHGCCIFDISLIIN